MRPEAEIRAEIERLNNEYSSSNDDVDDAGYEARIAALEWVLSGAPGQREENPTASGVAASSQTPGSATIANRSERVWRADPAPAQTDDALVEAMAKAIADWYWEGDCCWETLAQKDEYLEPARAALAAARPGIERAARAKALEDAAREAQFYGSERNMEWNDNIKPDENWHKRDAAYAVRDRILALKDQTHD